MALSFQGSSNLVDNDRKHVVTATARPSFWYAAGKAHLLTEHASRIGQPRVCTHAFIPVTVKLKGKIFAT